MAGRDLHWLTITEASKLLQSRQVSATEILEDTLEWVKKTDPVTRNFAYLAEKEAREEARARRRRDRARRLPRPSSRRTLHSQSPHQRCWRPDGLELQGVCRLVTQERRRGGTKNAQCRRRPTGQGTYA